MHFLAVNAEDKRSYKRHKLLGNDLPYGYYLTFFHFHFNIFQATMYYFSSHLILLIIVIYLSVRTKHCAPHCLLTDPYPERQPFLDHELLYISPTAVTVSVFLLMAQ